MLTHTLKADVIIIGGGTAGCFAARTLGARPDLHVILVEKATIVRSGCLAAGVNALNAYITRGKTPAYYARYAMRDAANIARWDLLISMSERLNHVARILEDEGLVFLKNDDGSYCERGPRNVCINGENIKPLLARAARRQPNVTVLEHVNVTDLLVDNSRVYGACGFGIRDGEAYVLLAKAFIVCTGGAAGLYRPNNPGFSRHKMWYPPFNTGAGLAMGILAGAEMTSFEMRFVALRCKDTIAPTGTIAQGVKAPQLNAKGMLFQKSYGNTTSERVWGCIEEKRAGRGPCYLHTQGIGTEAQADLMRAYLNMAPAQTLAWVEAASGPNDHDVEIEGTEPYVVGGHTASGYWVDEQRQTTIEGLFAAGDVAGGAPQKYVTGALAEGEIAAEAAARFCDALLESAHREGDQSPKDYDISAAASAIIASYESYLCSRPSLFGAEELEDAMQKIMDHYAGGISCDYRYNEAQLTEARRSIAALMDQLGGLAAKDGFELLHIFELRERLVVCRVLIEHLLARKETRWHVFAENTDYPQMSESFERYVNSRLVNDEVQIIFRELVREGEGLEHMD